MPKLTDKRKPNIMSIGELWEALAKFTKTRVEDNTRYEGEYPIDVRKAQMETLQTLVNEIELFHKKQ